MSSKTVILWDVMSTLVYDPYMNEFPDFFGVTWQDLLKVKHPTAWVDFELGTITEQTFFELFWPEFGSVDLDAFHDMLHDAYRFLPGIEPLLATLAERDDLVMHTLSNYPVWYQIIERKLELSRFMSWSFVSCHMKLRKPDVGIYTSAASALAVDPSMCIFIDDRGVNCKGAVQAGMRALKFEDAAQLERELSSMIVSR